MSCGQIYDVLLGVTDNDGNMVNCDLVFMVECNNEPEVVFATYSKYIGDTLENHINRVKHFDGNNYILGHNEIDGVKHPNFTKLDSLGNIEWSVRFVSQYQLFDFEQLDNGRFILVGRTEPVLVDNVLQDNESVIIQVNPSGSVFKETKHQNPGSETLVNIVRHKNPANPDFPFYVTGYHNKLVNPNLNFDTTGFHEIETPSIALDIVILMNLDGDGNINWTKRYSNGNDDEFASFLEPLSDGNLLLGGNVKINVSNSKSQLVKISGLDGSVIKSVKSNRPEVYRNCAELDASRMIVSSSSADRLYLSVVNSDLEPLSSYDLELSQFSEISDVKVMSNGLIAIVGLRSGDLPALMLLAINNNELSFVSGIRFPTQLLEISNPVIEVIEETIVFADSRINEEDSERKRDIVINQFDYEEIPFCYEAYSDLFLPVTLALEDDSSGSVEYNYPDGVGSPNARANPFISIDYCKPIECQIAMFYSAQCNILNLNSAPFGFEDEDAVTYSWSSPNTSFATTVSDTVWVYDGDLSEVIICLEATDGNCIAMTCDTVSVIKPLPPVYEDCPNEIIVETNECAVILGNVNYSAFDACQNTTIQSECVRSDGLSLDSSYEIGVTDITCTATSISGLTATCEFPIIVIDTEPPTCIFNGGSGSINNQGVFVLDPVFYGLLSFDNCSDVEISLNVTELTCDDLGENQIVLTVIDSSGNSSSCANFLYLEDPNNHCNITCDNTGVHFDGQDDYIIADSPLSGNTDYTIHLNFKPGSQTNGPFNRLIGHNGFEVELALNGNEVAYYNGSRWIEPGIIVDDGWHSVTLAREGTDYSLWLDSDLINSSSGPANLDFMGSIFIGSQKDVGELYTGELDNLSIWNRALDQMDVLQLHSDCLLTGDEPGLVLYYNFEEGLGSQDNSMISGPIDLAGGDNSGTFNEFQLEGATSNYVCNNLIIEELCNIIDECDPDTIPPTITCEPDTLIVEIGSNLMASISDMDLSIMAQDDCGQASIITGFELEVNCSAVGMQGLNSTVLAEDDSGNVSECQVDIIITDPNNFCNPCMDDNEPPFAFDCSVTMPLVITTELDSNGLSLISFEDWDARVLDNCSAVILPEFEYTAGCDDVGQTFLWDGEFLDDSGNSTPCQFGLETIDPNNYCACLNDTIPPEVLCPDFAITVNLNQNSEETISHLDYDIFAIDNCTELVLFSGSTLATCDMVDAGIQSFIVTVSDESDNSIPCELRFEVKDNSPVSIESCGAITRGLSLAMEVILEPSEVNAVINENCNFELSLERSLYDCSDLGFAQYTIYATDNMGSIDTCSNQIQIVDPFEICESECNASFVEIGVAECYFIELESRLDGFQSGEAYVWTVNGQFISEAQNLSHDLGGAGNFEVCLEVSDGSCTSTPYCESFSREVVFPVFANCPNVNIEVSVDENCEQSVTPPDIQVDFYCSIPGQLPGPISFARSDGKGINEPYTTGVRVLVTASFADDYGTPSLCQYFVDVIDDTSPIITDCAELNVFLDDTGTYVIDVILLDYNGSDNCGIVEVLLDVSDVDCDDLGVSTYEATIFDAAGNFDVCSNSLIVRDTISPRIEFCNEVQLNLDDTGVAQLDLADIDYLTIDNCSNNLNVQVESTNFSCILGLSSSYILTVTDDSGNTATCSNTVILDDVSPPMCQIESLQQLELDGNGIAVLSIDDIQFTASDNCAIDGAILVGAQVFDCNDLGFQNVTIEVSDVSGTSSSCSAQISIVDAQAPNCQVVDITVMLDANGQAFVDDQLLLNQAADNCSFQIMEISQTNFGCNDIGANTISFTVVDESGLETSCQTVVTVTTDDLNANWDSNIQGCRQYEFVPDNTSYPTYDWDFGDGTTSNEILPIHEYQGNGVYNVCLTVEDSGCSNTKCQELVVEFNCEGCFVVFNSEQDCYSLAMTSLVTDYTDNVTYNWTVNGVSVSSLQDFNYLAPGPGEVEICLFAQDEFCEDTFCETITITEVQPILASCPMNDVVLTVSVNCDPVFFIPDLEVVFFCENETIDPVGFQSIRSDGISINNPFGIGTTTVSTTFEDGYGAIVTCNYTVVVMDNLDPECISDSYVVELPEDGDTVLVQSDLISLVTDNCEVSSIELAISTFDCSMIGESFLVFVATDASGNTVSCNLSLTVTPPLLPDCIEGFMVEIPIDEEGNGALDIVPVNDAFSTSCGGLEYMGLTFEYTCADIGLIESDFVLSSDYGDSMTCAISIVVTE